MPDQPPSENQGGQPEGTREPTDNPLSDDLRDNQETECRHNDPKKKYRISDNAFRWITLGIDFLVFIAVAVYSVFAALQWIAMRDQIGITQSQIQSARDERRAWVTPFITKLAKPLAVGEKPSATIECKNTGKSLAFDAQISCTIIITKGKLPSEKWTLEKEPTRDRDFSRIIVAPDATISGTGQREQPLTQEELDGLRNETHYLYARGKIEYRDTFKKWHITTFCRWINGQNMDGLDLNACGRGDTAD